MAALLDNPVALDPEAVRAAEAVVQEYCGWHIAPSITETITVNGTNNYKLFLPSLKVTAITSVVEDGIPLSAASYVWSETGLLEKLYGWWSWKPRSIAVTLTHGYDTCPLSVRQVVKHLAEAGPGSTPIATAEVGQVKVTYSAPSPSFSALDSYRLPAV